MRKILAWALLLLALIACQNEAKQQKDNSNTPESNKLTSTGTSALTTAYENVFKTIQLNVTFKVEEIVSLNDSVAFVRTQSNGTQLIHANRQKTEELNREFFLMRNENSSWKIARYMFNQPK